MTERLKPHTLAGELAAEFAGTLILILFGVGVVAQVVAGGLGDHDSIAWAWGLGVTLRRLRRRPPQRRPPQPGRHGDAGAVPRLLLEQGRRRTPWPRPVGAFVAALLVRWNYTEVIAAVDPGHTIKTQGIFSTLPGNGALPVGTGGALRDQIIGTAILLFLILAVTDARSSAPGGQPRHR